MVYDGFDVYSVLDQYMTPLIKRKDINNRAPWHPTFNNAIDAVEDLKAKLEEMSMDRHIALLNQEAQENKLQ